MFQITLACIAQYILLYIAHQIDIQTYTYMCTKRQLQLHNKFRVNILDLASYDCKLFLFFFFLFQWISGFKLWSRFCFIVRSFCWVPCTRSSFESNIYIFGIFSARACSPGLTNKFFVRSILLAHSMCMNARHTSRGQIECIYIYT